jgi:hypothetical protein
MYALRVDSFVKWAENISALFRRNLMPQPPAHVGSSLADFSFYPEDGADTFLRNVGLHNIYTAPHPRRRHSSYDRRENLKSYILWHVNPSLDYATKRC